VLHGRLQWREKLKSAFKICSRSFLVRRTKAEQHAQKIAVLEEGVCSLAATRAAAAQRLHTLHKSIAIRPRNFRPCVTVNAKARIASLNR
jgi:hypothetical protein